MISQSKFLLLNPTLVMVYSLFLAFTVAYYLIALVVNVGARSFDLAAHKKKVAAWRARKAREGGPYPTVDFMLPIAGESIEMLRNTWAGVCQVMEEYPGRVAAFVLDDGGSEEAAALTHELEEAGYAFGYYPRPKVKIGDNTRGWMKKAGNLRWGFIVSDAYHNGQPGEHSVVLDADFRPRPDYLWETVPYMDEDPRLGILQTPQYFHVLKGMMNWLERGAGAVQELFYRSIQQARDQLDGAICVGTNAIYRRAALVENGGGPTLIGHSEDVHTGYDMRYKCATKWGLKYIPICLATGVCPNDLASFIKQQYRWCMGSMSLLGDSKFRRRSEQMKLRNEKMKLRTRFCYLSGFCYYIHTAIFTFVGPTIPIVLLVVFPEEVLLRNYSWIVPSLLYNMVVFPLWHNCKYGLDAFAVKLVYGWAHAFAIVDILRARRMGWSATGSKAKSEDFRVRNARWLMGGWGFITGAPWIGGSVYYMLTWDNWLDFLPNLFTGLVYIAVILRAISPTGMSKSEKAMAATEAAKKRAAERDQKPLGGGRHRR
jgi:cellulose synthase (UDP-forming)